MDFLGMGPLELVLILVIALLVFGPDKLPEISAKMGRSVRELRQLSREITQGVNTLTAPVDELRKPFDDAAQVVHQVTDAAETLRNPAWALQQSLSQQLTGTSTTPAENQNTIAPPRLQGSGETVSALQAADSAPPEPIAPVSPPSPPSDVSQPAAAIDTTADPATTESPPRTSER